MNIDRRFLSGSFDSAMFPIIHEDCRSSSMLKYSQCIHRSPLENLPPSVVAEESDCISLKCSLYDLYIVPARMTYSLQVTECRLRGCKWTKNWRLQAIVRHGRVGGIRMMNFTFDLVIFVNIRYQSLSEFITLLRFSHLVQSSDSRLPDLVTNRSTSKTE